MNADKSIKVLLVLIAVALWGNLLRPFLITAAVQAQPSLQAGTASPMQAPIILKAQEGIPYIVLSGGHLSVWYVDTQSEKLNPKTITGRQIMESTVLVRADDKPLP